MKIKARKNKSNIKDRLRVILKEKENARDKNYCHYWRYVSRTEAEYDALVRRLLNA